MMIYIFEIMQNGIIPNNNKSDYKNKEKKQTTF
jgi:hypothetical protein